MPETPVANCPAGMHHCLLDHTLIWEEPRKLTARRHREWKRVGAPSRKAWFPAARISLVGSLELLTCWVHPTRGVEKLQLGGRYVPWSGGDLRSGEAA